jgi:hypothetical protein
MSATVLPFAPRTQQYREVIKLPTTVYRCCKVVGFDRAGKELRCPAEVIMSKEREGNGWRDVLPIGWKRVTVTKGQRSWRGVICRWCAGIGERMQETGQSCLVEVIGGRCE